MEIVYYLSLFVLGVFFVYAGIHHLTHHDNLVLYAASTKFPVPYVAGWPTGALLAVIGVGVASGQALFVLAGAAFVALATAWFHRDFKDTATHLHWALVAALLAISAPLF